MKNYVAKHAHKFNRCSVFYDRTKYSRKNMPAWDLDDEPPVRADLYWR